MIWPFEQWSQSVPAWETRRPQRFLEVGEPREWAIVPLAVADAIKAAQREIRELRTENERLYERLRKARALDAVRKA